MGPAQSCPRSHRKGPFASGRSRERRPFGRAVRGDFVKDLRGFLGGEVGLTERLIERGDFAVDALIAQARNQIGKLTAISGACLASLYLVIEIRNLAFFS